jgi:hypothetical protein
LGFSNKSPGKIPSDFKKTERGKTMISPSCVFTVAFAAASALCIPVVGQEIQGIPVGNQKLTGTIDDWTHHHVVFSDPGTSDDAIRRGEYEQWFRIVNDPRYVMQQMKRRLPVQGPAADDVARFGEAKESASSAFAHGLMGPFERARIRALNPPIDKDWSMVLGSGTTTAGSGMFPAKFSFNATSTSPINCASATTPDYVVYNTSATGSTTQASVVAYDNLYSSCTGQVPSVYWAFNTAGKVVTSVVLSLDGTQAAYIQTPASGNAQLVVLKWAAKPTGRSVTSGSTNITNGSKTFTATAGLTSMDVGAGISGTGIPAGDTIATVTSATAGTLTTAATANGTAAESLAITADAGGPDTLSSNSGYPTCAAPCMISLSFSGTTRSDSISSPFYDYTNDALYVGDASGGLHKFHPVFNGTPAEVGTPWASPSTTALTSPVYDAASENVFVGDASGFLYSVSTSGAVTKSVQLAVSPGFHDGPLVDSTNGDVFAFTSSDLNASATTSPCAPTSTPIACSGVILLPTSFTGSSKYSECVIGQTNTDVTYAGAFDNQYWTSDTGAGKGTGNLYVSAGNVNEEPKLAEVPMVSGAFGTTGNANCKTGYTLLGNMTAEDCSVNVANPMVTALAAASPVTEFLNGTTDRIYTSVSASGDQTGCTGACIYSWTTTSTLAVGAAAAAGSTETGGTSGIIVDNSSATAGASEVYFSTLSSGTCTTSGTFTSGGCAVQASQSAP